MVDKTSLLLWGRRLLVLEIILLWLCFYFLMFFALDLYRRGELPADPVWLQIFWVLVPYFLLLPGLRLSYQHPVGVGVVLCAAGLVLAGNIMVQTMTEYAASYNKLTIPLLSIWLLAGGLLLVGGWDRRRFRIG